jgi:hypothetical protein
MNGGSMSTRVLALSTQGGVLPRYTRIEYLFRFIFIKQNSMHVVIYMNFINLICSRLKAYDSTKTLGVSQHNDHSTRSFKYTLASHPTG